MAISNPLTRYAGTYINPQGPGDDRPTALQIIQDNNCAGQWAGKVVLITGATSGIGVETARALHETGADVYITARDEAKAKAVVNDILGTSKGKGKLEIIKLDLESLSSAKAAASEFLSRSSKLNILINNAGIMACPESKTNDGFERQFGVNHLGPFVLTSLLLPTLLKSSEPTFSSRVVFVSSSSHRYSEIRWDNLDLAGNYDPYVAYGQSKTASIWTANYIDRVYGPRGVRAMSLHPGGIFTNLQQYAGEEQLQKWKSSNDVMPFMLSPDQGAATTVWAATVDELSSIGGKYLADCTIAPPTTNATSALDSGVAAHAYKPEDEDRLWALSLRLVGLEDI